MTASTAYDAPFRVLDFAGVARVNVWRDTWTRETYASGEVLDARAEFGPGVAEAVEASALSWVQAKLAAALAGVGP